MANDWRLFAFASAGFAALTAILAKVGVAGINSSFATFFRTAVVLLLSAIVVWRSAAWPSTSLPLKSIVFLTLSGLATGLSWLCYFRALQLGPVSRVAPIDKLSVVLVLIFAFAFLGEALSARAVLGGALIAVGAVLLAT